MRYLCLVYGEEAVIEALPADERHKLDTSSLGYDRELEERGCLILAQALESARKARSLRVRKGKLTVTDGPFAETKEQLLGFVLIEAKDDDDALAVAADIPLARLGTVELRRIGVVEI